MKLIFFLIAFCLVSIRVYFTWSGKDREKRGFAESDMVIKSDNFYEEINYSGKFQLSDDETSFKSISPGGYFKFRKNDIKVKAESNLRGEIDYTIYDGNNNLPMDEQGKLVVAQAIKEMIIWGYDANDRMERVYHKGGARALLNEVDSMKTDQMKVLYLNRLFAIDSLLPNYLPFIIKKIASMSSDQDKVDFLSKIPGAQLKNQQTDSAYFEIIKGIGSDMDRANLFQKMIDKGLIAGPYYDSLLVLISGMGSDIDKTNLYKKLIGQKDLKEAQWIKLQDKISLLGSDFDKTNLLVELAPKMPLTDAVKLNYQKAAKTLGNDNDYGRAMRAIQ